MLSSHRTLVRPILIEFIEIFEKEGVILNARPGDPMRRVISESAQDLIVDIFQLLHDNDVILNQRIVSAIVRSIKATDNSLDYSSLTIFKSTVAKLRDNKIIINAHLAYFLLNNNAREQESFISCVIDLQQKLPLNLQQKFLDFVNGNLKVECKKNVITVLDWWRTCSDLSENTQAACEAVSLLLQNAAYAKNIIKVINSTIYTKTILRNVRATLLFLTHADNAITVALGCHLLISSERFTEENIAIMLLHPGIAYEIATLLTPSFNFFLAGESLGCPAIDFKSYLRQLDIKQIINIHGIFSYLCKSGVTTWKYYYQAISDLNNLEAILDILRFMKEFGNGYPSKGNVEKIFDQSANLADHVLEIMISYLQKGGMKQKITVLKQLTANGLLSRLKDKYPDMSAPLHHKLITSLKDFLSKVVTWPKQELFQFIDYIPLLLTLAFPTYEPLALEIATILKGNISKLSPEVFHLFASPMGQAVYKEILKQGSVRDFQNNSALLIPVVHIPDFKSTAELLFGRIRLLAEGLSHAEGMYLELQLMHTVLSRLNRVQDIKPEILNYFHDKTQGKCLEYGRNFWMRIIHVCLCIFAEASEFGVRLMQIREFNITALDNVSQLMKIIEESIKSKYETLRRSTNVVIFQELEQSLSFFSYILEMSLRIGSYKRAEKLTGLGQNSATMWANPSNSVHVQPSRVPQTCVDSVTSRGCLQY